MKKLFILNTLNEHHFISNGLILEANRFEMNKGIFEKNGYEVKMLKEFISVKEINELKTLKLNITKYHNAIQNKACTNFISYIMNISTRENIYLYFISHGWHKLLDNNFITNNKNIYKILFTDDPHAFFLVKNKYHEKTLSLDGSYKATGICINNNYINPFLNIFNMILTPSKVFFKNIKYGKMDNIHQFNYSINETFPLINNINKNDKILLSGAIGNHYRLRSCINNNINKNNKDYKIFKRLAHPGYNNYDNNKIAGYKYLKKISEYKAAISDNLKFPLGYCVYKHLEILHSGTLGLYLEDEALFKYLGLEKNKHYIPVYLDKEDPDKIKNLNEIKNIIKSPIADKISKKGQQYVLENFNTCINCQNLLILYRITRHIISVPY